MSEEDEESLDAKLFKEPEGYYKPETPETYAEHTLLSGEALKLRLVGHNPLWGHLLWNAGRVVSDYLEENAGALIKGKDVVELGAGAGLPSLVCAARGAQTVVVTDYPDAALIENLRFNISNCGQLLKDCSIHAEGYLWGASIKKLTSFLHDPTAGFDLLILADLLFNHSEHIKLLLSVQQLMKMSKDSRALVFFTPYRPWLLGKDLAFFVLAKEAGLLVEKVLETTMGKVMFEEDPGLILITGYPSSGKTHRAFQLVAYLQEKITTSLLPQVTGLKVHHVSPHSLGLSRQAYAEARTEKDARAAEYSAVKRVLGRDTIVVADGLNYIKGYRYQLYCEAKAVQTASCVVHVGTPVEKCREINKRIIEDPAVDGGYEEAVFENLVYRYEEPNGMTRWDSPLFTVVYDDPEPPFEQIWEAIMGSEGAGKTVKANLATVKKPAAESDYLYELDKVTQEIVTIILDWQKDHPGEGGGELSLSDLNESIELPASPVSLPQLQRTRRQFISLNRQHLLPKDRIRALLRLAARSTSKHRHSSHPKTASGADVLAELDATLDAEAAVTCLSALRVAEDGTWLELCTLGAGEERQLTAGRNVSFEVEIEPDPGSRSLGTDLRKHAEEGSGG
ncbi:hypothetical protein MMC16_005956 [Acarospora aff. strigata]|nr:hypothetical protein [Acarospora aff. strigata]